MKNNTVVYIHRKKTDDTIFYVGIGKPSRPYRNKGRSSLWNRTVNKHGYYIEIILEDLSQEEACEIEIYLIEKLGRRDLKKGSLVNLTDGGEGILGHEHSKETKKKISEAGKGRKLSEETKRKLSEAVKGRKHSDETKKKISEIKSRMSDETKKKISESSKGKKMSEEAKKKMSKAKSKKVINTVTGEIYNSVIEASKAINISVYTLRNWITGKNPNKSNLKYLK